MMPRFRSLFIFVAVVALLLGVALLAYARWSQPILEGAAALDADDSEAALAAYNRSAERFEQFAPTKQVFARDFSLISYNRLALLYERGEYDPLIEAAESAPPDAAPHYWLGCALFAKAAQEQKPETQLEWLGRAEEEFKLALKDAPDDWDTKYNYELSARLAAAMRNQGKGKQNQTAPTNLMQLLRPQPTQRQQRPIKKVG
jgi:hypothetical protein